MRWSPLCVALLSLGVLAFTDGFRPTLTPNNLLPVGGLIMISLYKSLNFKTVGSLGSRFRQSFGFRVRLWRAGLRLRDFSVWGYSHNPEPAKQHRKAMLAPSPWHFSVLSLLSV